MNLFAPILRTKLHIPPLRADAIARTRLMARLNDAQRLGQSFVLVSAPAGFGKSTVVRAWAHAENLSLAWLALDDADNDPTRFWAHCIAALQTVAPHAGKSILPLLYAPQAVPPEALVTLLVNDLAAQSEMVRFVLDDFHLITNDTLHRALAYWLDHLPPNFQLILTTRADPPLPLARLRARGKMLELRADDLRFSTDEAAQFLNRAMGLTLTASQIAALEKRTEGWIAGLQLAALSLRGTDDAEQFIDAFTGSHRYVMDYLVDEVLAHRDESTQNFLLQTSTLPRLNAELCDAVRQTDDSATYLAQLERANLFLFPLDETRRWFRYHPLFADLLRHRLQKTAPAFLPQLHQRASDWFARNNLPADAIDHALAAGAYAQAAALITQHLGERFKQNEHVTLQKWLNALPDAIFAQHPKLSVARARIDLNANELDAAAQNLDGAAEHATALALEPQRALRGEIAVYRSCLAFMRGDSQTALEWSEQALAYLPPEDLDLQSRAYFWRGGALIGAREFQEALVTFQRAQHLAELAHDDLGALHALCNVGALEDTRGNLRRAYGCFTEGIARTQALGLGNSIPSCVLHFNLSEAHYEWNQLPQALELAKHGVELARILYLPRITAHAQGQYARVLYGAGEVAQAKALLAQTLALIDRQKIPLHYAVHAQALQMRMDAADKEFGAAQRRAARHADMLTEPARSNTHFVLACGYARVLLAQQDTDAAERILFSILESLQQTRVQEWELETLVLLAACRRARGANDAAQDFLERALELAEPEGYVRTFVDEGEPMRAMLVEAKAKMEMRARHADTRAARLSHYIARLLAAFPDSRTTPHTANSQAQGDALTERETQVLQFMAQGMANAEIAARLHITVATVKKHSGLLFGKLGVKNRTEAVIRARARGLI